MFAMPVINLLPFSKKWCIGIVVYENTDDLYNTSNSTAVNFFMNCSEHPWYLYPCRSEYCNGDSEWINPDNEYIEDLVQDALDRWEDL